MDTAPLENSFQAAEPAAKSSADKVVSAIKSADYAGALTELQTLTKNADIGNVISPVAAQADAQSARDALADLRRRIRDLVG